MSFLAIYTGVYWLAVAWLALALVSFTSWYQFILTKLQQLNRRKHSIVSRKCNLHLVFCHNLFWVRIIRFFSICLYWRNLGKKANHFGLLYSEYNIIIYYHHRMKLRVWLTEFCFEWDMWKKPWPNFFSQVMIRD